MSSFFASYLENTSIVDVIQIFWSNTVLYLDIFFALLKDLNSNIFSSFVEITPTNIQFDSFQWELFKIFSVILLINLILIVIVWRIYGKSICDRFMRLSTLKEIEELKASVSKLKLPKEYTPRI